MNFKPIKVIAFTLIVLAWILMTFFFVGCANVSYKTIPDGMSEDAQDYPTKYNMMDSPDGRRNPNAQVNIFGATYWQFLSLQYIEYMSKKDKYTFQYEYADEIGRETNHKITFNATTIDEICGKLRDFLKGCGFSFDEIGVIDYEKEDQDEKV